MRSVVASQRAIYARDTLAPVPLLRLRTWTDRIAGTIQATKYFSNRPFQYEYGGGSAKQFEAFLAKVDQVVRSMAHLPSGDGSYAGAIGSGVRFSLANLPYRSDTARLWPTLRALALGFSDLEIATVLGAPEDPLAAWDLTGYAGTEHQVWFRGELARVEGVSNDAIQIRAQSRVPAVPFLLALDASITDARDLGARLPLPYGRAIRVPAINWQVGWQSSLSAPLTAEAGAGTVLGITDTTGFPLSSFTLRVDAEEILIASRGAAADDLVVSARAQGGTVAIPHSTGGVVVEVVAETIIVLGQGASAVQKVYALNPYSQVLFEVTQGLVTPRDTALVPGASLATLRFSAAEFSALAQQLYQASRVSVQPEYSTAGTSTVRTISFNQFDTAGSYSSTCPQTRSVNTITTAGGTSTTVPGLRFTMGSGAGLLTNQIASWRIKASASWNLSGGNVRLRIRTGNMPGIGNDNEVFSIPIAGSDSDTWFSSSHSGGFPETAFNGATMFAYLTGTAPVVGGTVSITLSLEFTEVNVPDIQRVVDAQATGPASAFGLTFYADIDGPVAPASYVDGYAFDESAAGYSTSGCAVALDTVTKAEGTASLKISPTVTALPWLSSASGWTIEPAGSSAAVTADTGDKTEGANSIKYAFTGTGYNDFSRIYKRGDFTPVDLTGMLIALDVKLDNASALGPYRLTATTGFSVGLTSDATWATNLKIWFYGTSHGIGSGWTTLIIDPSTVATYVGVGTLDITNVRGIRVGFEPLGGPPVTFHADNPRIFPKTVKVQRNATAAAVDLTSPQNAYRVALRQAEARQVEDSGSVLYFSDTAGSGTTPPANRRTLPLAGTDFGAAAWDTAEVAKVDVGSPTVTNVETIGLSISLRSTPPVGLATDPVIWVDHLECRDDTASPYDAAVGSLLEHPADVMRHFIGEFCGEGQGAIDSTSWDAAITATPGFTFGSDLRGFGDSFAAIAMRVAYEMRSNLIQVDATSSTLYRLLVAGAGPSYSFGSAVRTITEWKRFSETGRDIRELGARFICYYDFDPSLGSDESAYRATLQATPEQSDVASVVTASALATIEARDGRQGVQRIFLRGIHDEDTAKDVFGYFVREATRTIPLWIIEGAAWWEAFDLECGDIVSLTPPWESSPVTARVIEVSKGFQTETVDLRVVEVP